MPIFKKQKKEEKAPEKPALREHPLDDNHKVVLNSKRLIPIVIQDYLTREDLRLAYMDRWALDVSLGESKLHIYSRSKRKQMLFGADKGLEFEIKSVKLDVTRRSLLFEVLSSGQSDSYSSFVYPIEANSNSNGSSHEDFECSDSESW